VEMRVDADRDGVPDVRERGGVAGS
jgi:hypothetical protein